MNFKFLSVWFSAKSNYGIYIIPTIKLSKTSSYRYSRTLSATICWLIFSIQVCIHQHQRLVNDKFQWYFAWDDNNNVPHNCFGPDEYPTT